MSFLRIRIASVYEWAFERDYAHRETLGKYKSRPSTARTDTASIRTLVPNIILRLFVVLRNNNLIGSSMSYSI